MKGIHAYWKIDHTLCLNNLAGNIEFNIDECEPNDPDTDCKNVEEMVECLETIEKAVEKADLFEKITPGNPVWFYTYDDELHEGWVDFIECNQRDGWTVSMHYKPANKTGSVYTARLWKYSLKEYGKRFACTKEELNNEQSNSD